MKYINLTASILFCALYFLVNDFEKLEHLYLGISLVYFLVYQMQFVLEDREKPPH